MTPHPTPDEIADFYISQAVERAKAGFGWEDIVHLSDGVISREKAREIVFADWHFEQHRASRTSA